MTRLMWNRAAKPRRLDRAVSIFVGLVLTVAAGRSAWAQAPDPGAVGPLAVIREEYNFGTQAFRPVNFPASVEVLGSVHYPSGLAGGPYPLIVFLHGRHSTCYQGTSTFLRWPCTASQQSIPSYKGYDYIAANLASNGYVVVSISANGINAYDSQVSDFGAQARAELIQRHLSQWQTFNTTTAAPFSGKFIGKIDLQKVGTMGHSRGGEGVVRHFLYNATLGSPYGIKAVFPLAPVDFSRPIINNVPLAVMLPYCDGDVNDNQGVHYYDDARYNVPGDTAGKHTILVMGANHNYFNTIWTPGFFTAGTSDDWLVYTSGGSTDPHCGTGANNKRLTSAQQRGTGLAYITAVMRVYVGGELQFLPNLTGDSTPPPSALTTNLYVSYLAPDTAATRRDVNRLLSTTELTTNTLGGATSQTGLTPQDLCGGLSPQPLHCLVSQATSRQPHTTPSSKSTKRGLSQLRTGWSTAGSKFTNNLPVGSGDVSAFDWLTFRTSVNFADTRNPSGAVQNFTVVLTDGEGASVGVRVSDVSGALYYPPGTKVSVPKVFLNTVRMPLSSFPGVNLADIRSVELRFDQTSGGALLIADLAFAGTP